MPFARPTLTALIDDAAAIFDSRIPGADSRLRRSILNALARVVAGATHGLYGFLAWIFDQTFADTAATSELERHASIYGLSRLAGTFAVGDVTFGGEDGREVPAGTILLRSDGREFTTSASATVSGGTATVSVSSATAGVAANTAAGSALVFQSPVEGVDATAIVASGGLSGGTDTESDAALRARLLERIQRPPAGGAVHDYVAWAKAVPGVTRAWVLPGHAGAGTVGVIIVRDGESPITPDAGEVAAVAAYIDARRPVTAGVTVFAPTLVPQPFTLHVEPDTAAVRAAVAAELEDLVRREMAPDGTTPLLLSHVREAISSAQGEVDHSLTVPNADVTPAVGELLTVGPITWV